jgi:hypothetical protein
MSRGREDEILDAIPQRKPLRPDGVLDGSLLGEELDLCPLELSAGDHAITDQHDREASRRP